MNRRGFLSGILAACAAPAIVKAELIMPVRTIVTPLAFQDITTNLHDYLLQGELGTIEGFRFVSSSSMQPVADRMGRMTAVQLRRVARELLANAKPDPHFVVVGADWAPYLKGLK